MSREVCNKSVIFRILKKKRNICFIHFDRSRYINICIWLCWQRGHEMISAPTAFIPFCLSTLGEYWAPLHPLQKRRRRLQLRHHSELQTQLVGTSVNSENRRCSGYCKTWRFSAVRTDEMLSGRSVSVFEFHECDVNSSNYFYYDYYFLFLSSRSSITWKR